MKPTINKITVFMPFLVVAALAACISCASLNKTAYKTTGVTSVTVDAAMMVWGTYVKAQRAAGKDIAAQEVVVKDAFQKYQAAATLLCDAGIAYAKNKDAAPLLMASEVAGAALADLLEILKIYLPSEMSKKLTP